MTVRFEIGELIHNKLNDNDGCVTEVTSDGYHVAVPLGCYSWILGKKNVFWRESEVEVSQNDLLRDPSPMSRVA